MDFTPKGAAVYCAIKNSLLPKVEGGWDDTNFNKFWDDFMERLEKSRYAIIKCPDEYKVSTDKEPMSSDEIRNFINVELLEHYYSERICDILERPGNKGYIAILLREKLMLFEIYKALCLSNDCTNDNADDTHNNSKR